MISVKNDITEIEARIIDAANHVFLKYGVDAATMGQIADEAGINRTSLNYYFRSKKHLFETVLNNLENKIVPTLSKLINDDTLELIEKIEIFIDEYIDLITKYPMVPSFIVSELTRDPNWIIQFFKQPELNFEKLEAQITFELSQGKVYPLKLEDLVVNVVGLCVFPLLTQPLLIDLFFNENVNEFEQYMATRKENIKKIMQCWLKPC